MEQKQLVTGSSCETAGELRRRILDLEEQNRVLDAFIENSTDAIQISDRNLVTLRINRAYEVLTGIRRDELVGVPVEELVKNHLISESCGAIVAETKKPHTIVQTFYRTGRSAHVSCTPVFDSCGEIEFYICNDRDLNEISSLQQELDKIRGLNDQYLQELESIKAQMGDRNKLIVADKEMLKVLALAARVAKVDSTALLLGETGVGKDEIARFIHQNSGRSDRRFVPINCAAITESLFESELFGHEGHAFTGAGSKVKPGLLEAADHGTLFLDEVGELSLNMQAKLLHVLQNRSFIRVGGNEPVQVDIRVIAATNCDLEEMVQQKRFREDLYYRLNAFLLSIPPLAARRGDVELLANHFLHKFSAALGKRVQAINAEARGLLYRYPWPGNVRELENAIERAVNVCGGQELMPCDFPSAMLEHEAVSSPGRKNGWLWAQETETIRKAIRETNGNLRQAAILLGISRSTLYLKIKKSKLSREELLGPSPD